MKLLRYQREVIGWIATVVILGTGFLVGLWFACSREARQESAREFYGEDGVR